MMQSKRVDVPILHDVFVETYVNGVVTVKVGSEACRLEKDTNGVYTTSDLRALSETCHRLFRDDSQQMRCRFSRFVETNVPGSKVCVPDAPPSELSGQSLPFEARGANNSNMRSAALFQSDEPTVIRSATLRLSLRCDQTWREMLGNSKFPSKLGPADDKVDITSLLKMSENTYTAPICPLKHWFD